MRRKERARSRDDAGCARNDTGKAGKSTSPLNRAGRTMMALAFNTVRETLRSIFFKRNGWGTIMVVPLPRKNLLRSE